MEEAATNKELTFYAGLFAGLVSVVFGSNAVAIKMALEGFGPFTTAGIRFGLASIILFLWAIFTKRPLVVAKGNIIHLFLLPIIFTTQFSLLNMGISKTFASRATLLINLQPFFVLLIAHFFATDEKITLRKFLGLSLGFMGFLFVFFEKKGLTEAFRIGDFIIILSTLVWASSAVYIKSIISEFRPFQIILYSMAASTPLFFLEAFLSGEIMFIAVNPTAIGALLYQSLVTTSLGFVAWIVLLKKYGLVSLHSFIFIMPIVGVILGGFILDEPLTIKIIAALIMIVLGIVVINAPKITS